MLRGTTLVPQRLIAISRYRVFDYATPRLRDDATARVGALSPITEGSGGAYRQSAPRLGDEFGDRWLPVPRTPGSLGKPTGCLLLPRVANRKSTRLNSSHSQISYAVFCLKKKK